MVEKAKTGIAGFDEVAGGGLPKGRATLLCGGPGCGKTLFGLQFLVHGALECNEPGVCIAFEETREDITDNFRSLGYDLDDLMQRKLIDLDFIRVDRSEFEESGDYDLEALFLRLGNAIDAIGAKRVLLDTIESLFSGFENEAILRSELRRLFYWFKERGITAVVTGERGGSQTYTRRGLEEYVSDCVVLLDHRVQEQVSTRRLRIVKYRGSSHGTNEYPFVIDAQGITVMPITSVGLNHKVSDERISTGIKELDEMLGVGGLYRGSSVLISGTAGTGKTSVAAQISNACCARGESVLYFAFEESESQLLRNMKSIGIDLAPWVKRGLLRHVATRPTAFGLELHLSNLYKHIDQFKPKTVVLDPITNFTMAADQNSSCAMLMRLLDYLKSEQITAICTSLTISGHALEQSEVGVSSLMDTWLMLRATEVSGERNRLLYLLKSRGMAHSNQVREFQLTAQGVQLADVYVGMEGVLTGSAGRRQKAKERAAELLREQEFEIQKQAFERKKMLIEAEIIAKKAELEAQEAEINQLFAQRQAYAETVASAEEEMTLLRLHGSANQSSMAREKISEERI